MRRLLALLSLLTLALCCHAASLTVSVPGKGPYKFWTDTKPIGAAPEPGDLFESNPQTLTVPDDGYLAILDTVTGNICIRKTKGLKSPLKLSDSDFDSIGEFQVKIGHMGKPVEAASVTLTDTAGAHSQLLDSSAQGKLTFYGVKQGRVDVKVQYNVKGKPADPMITTKEFGHLREQPVPIFDVEIPDEVATVDSGAGAATGTMPMPANSGDAPAATPAPAAKEPPTASRIIVKTLTMLLGFGVVGGLIYLAYYLVKKDPKAFADKLTSLGVQIPKDPNDPTADPAIPPVAPVAPAPVQKIILDDAAPTPLGFTAAPSISTPTVATGASKLVTETGAVLTLPEGSTLIGREVQLGVPIADPSTLSRRHAELVKQGDHLLVRDLGSTNGTYVNGRKIDSDTPLAGGDQVQFGAVKFRVEA